MDQLRSRIAAAIKTVLPVPYAARDGYFFSAADAVIAELGLDKEFGCAGASHHGCRCSHRYVTEWETDDV